MSEFAFNITILCIFPTLLITSLFLVGPITNFNTGVRTFIVIILSWIGSLFLVFMLSMGAEYAVNKTKTNLKNTIVQEVIGTLQYQTKGN